MFNSTHLGSGWRGRYSYPRTTKILRAMTAQSPAQNAGRIDRSADVQQYRIGVYHHGQIKRGVSHGRHGHVRGHARLVEVRAERMPPSVRCVCECNPTRTHRPGGDCPKRACKKAGPLDRPFRLYSARMRMRSTQILLVSPGHPRNVNPPSYGIPGCVPAISTGSARSRNGTSTADRLAACIADASRRPTSCRRLRRAVSSPRRRC